MLVLGSPVFWTMAHEPRAIKARPVTPMPMPGSPMLVLGSIEEELGTPMLMHGSIEAELKVPSLVPEILVPKLGSPTPWIGYTEAVLGSIKTQVAGPNP